MNKRPLLVVVVALCSMNANAVTEMEKCEIASSIGEIAMTVYQGAGNFEKYHKDIEKKFPGLGATFLNFSVLASKEPIFQTRENKKRAINEFRNNVFLTCVEDMKK